MGVEPHAVTWEALPKAREAFRAAFQHVDPDTHAEAVQAVREMLCELFSADEKCQTKSNTIQPLGASEDGAKRLKMRMATPGGGKSGGLRVAVVVYCDEPRVVFCNAFPRSKDPSDADFERAFGDVDPSS